MLLVEGARASRVYAHSSGNSSGSSSKGYRPFVKYAAAAISALRPWGEVIVVVVGVVVVEQTPSGEG